MEISVLADRRALVKSVARLRWAEWGHPPEPVDFGFWLDATVRESGRDAIPITWVAVNDEQDAVGAVGLIESDPDDFRDRSPWLVGMIVAPEHRGEGIGSELVATLESWAASQGFDNLWVATAAAERFYQKCGWRTVTSFVDETGQPAVILERRLTTRA